jgi:hypothetical protein
MEKIKMRWTANKVDEHSKSVEQSYELEESYELQTTNYEL